MITRDEWDAREPTDVATVDPDDRTGIAIHHSVTPTDRSVKWIQDFHMGSRGWADIGYNFLVREGEIYEGRGWDVRGAHAAPHNTTHVGICWVGDSRTDELTNEDELALTWLVREAEQRFGPLSVDGHGALPGQATECPGDHLREWMAGEPWRKASTNVITLDVNVVPEAKHMELTGNTLFITLGDEPAPAPKPKPEPEPAPDLPVRPKDGLWQPGQIHPSFKLLGERFQEWLGKNDIAHDGDGYQTGAMYSKWDDFNTRKVQSLMSNPPDPVGKAYLGPKQWERVFTEDRPNNSELPVELRGPVPPQLREPGKEEPEPLPKTPTLPKPDQFQPGVKGAWVTLMGERFLKWLRPDEIHYAGSAYEPGPRYSVYDDRNVRAVQALMGNVPDIEGSEFFGPKQWAMLFEEGRPKGAEVPDELKPGGKSKTSDPSPSGSVPADGLRITQHYGVPNSGYTAGEHTGVDFGDSGSDVIRSVGAGTVVSAVWAGAYGNRVVVKHANGRYSHYAHLRQINVSKGDKVSRGSDLGLMGNTGNSTGKHLHYQESSGGWGYWDYKRPIMLGFGGY